MQPQTSRRTMLKESLAAAGAVGVAAQAQPANAAEGPSGEPFRYCLNTSTLRGQKLPLTAEIDIAARAGFRGIEPWVSEIDEHVKSGGTLADLRKRISDLGLSVEGVIGFAQWIVDDDAARAKGLDEARRTMDLTAQIGGKRIAAPPAGISDKDHLDLPTMAARYRTLVDVGVQYGVDPQVELWGFARVLSRLSEVAYVAIECGSPRAGILCDSYHLYKGGTDYEMIRMLSGDSMHVFHINDYPAKPERTEITDAHRVFPGDGVAPLGTLLKGLRDIGYRGALSLELFNREYWNQDALLVARMGFEKTRETVQKALA